jgi:hypothetical protein
MCLRCAKSFSTSQTRKTLYEMAGNKESKIMTTVVITINQKFGMNYELQIKLKWASSPKLKDSLV